MDEAITYTCILCDSPHQMFTLLNQTLSSPRSYQHFISYSSFYQISLWFPQSAGPSTPHNAEKNKEKKKNVVPGGMSRLFALQKKIIVKKQEGAE